MSLTDCRVSPKPVTWLNGPSLKISFLSYPNVHNLGQGLTAATVRNNPFKMNYRTEKQVSLVEYVQMQ